MAILGRSKFKPAKGIVMYKMYLEVQFREIKDFILEMKDLIEIKQKELERSVEREIKATHPNNEQSIIDFYIEDIIKYDRTYIELLMNSAFISSFSLFESAFSRICKHSKQEKGSNLSLQDLSGNGIIEKCKKYIEKVIEVDLISLNTLWNEITTYNKVRNLIVHNSAHLVSDKNKILEKHELFSYMSKNPFINFKDEGRGDFYIKDHQFIIEFCEKAEKYLSEVITKVLEATKSSMPTLSGNKLLDEITGKIKPLLIIMLCL